MIDFAPSEPIKQKAKELGFDFCGIAEALPLESERQRLKEWLDKKMHKKMHYMERYFEARINPTLFVPQAKSVITFMINYFPQHHKIPSKYKISKYAYGKDYHKVIKKKLHIIDKWLKEKYYLKYDIVEDSKSLKHSKDITYTHDSMLSVDSAPVLEKAWAVKSGLGWIGKNGNLIRKGYGSFFFLATIITKIPFQPDIPYIEDYCGTCTKCIDACPTQAILPDKVIDGGKCISYYTIEPVSKSYPKKSFDDWIFGCDICQDVCPWNKFSIPHKEPEFKPLFAILNFTDKDWENLTEEDFNAHFKQSPLKRPKFLKFKKNIEHAKKYRK